MAAPLREPRLPWLELAGFGLALVVFSFGAQGGPGWSSTSSHAVLALQLDRTAQAPLYDVLAAVFAHLPLGEPGFRLGLLGAVLGAATLAGVIAAARAVLREPIAGAIAAVVLALAPPFRDAAGTAAPALLATAGVIWVIALAASHARAASPRTALATTIAIAMVVGSAPWLGLGIGAVAIAWLVRTGMPRRLLAPVLAGFGILVIALWAGAIGTLPAAMPTLGPVVAASGRGAAALVVGVGLAGIGFAALTGLGAGRWVALLIALVAGDAIAFDHDAVALVATLAVGVAVVPAAVKRIVPSDRPWLITLCAGAPLALAALLLGPAFGVDDPGAAPVRLAADMIDTLPAGPGVIVATRDPVWFAIEHEQLVTGARPDLTLAPPLSTNRADVVIASALRGGYVAGSDIAAFGRLDPRRAVPAGRGFALLGTLVDHTSPLPDRARYASAIGAEQAARADLARAAYEAANGHLDAAARAIGLAERFGAADLAILASAIATTARPALFGFLPEASSIDVTIDLFGDDLAWVAGIAQPELPATAPMPRRLHERWQQLFLGATTVDDPRIVALGPAAVRATAAMWQVLGPKK